MSFMRSSRSKTQPLSRFIPAQRCGKEKTVKIRRGVNRNEEERSVASGEKGVVLHALEAERWKAKSRLAIISSLSHSPSVYSGEGGYSQLNMPNFGLPSPLNGLTNALSIAFCCCES